MNLYDSMWTFSGLDNDVGAPAAVTAHKEGRQKNASKKRGVCDLENNLFGFHPQMNLF